MVNNFNSKCFDLKTLLAGFDSIQVTFVKLRFDPKPGATKTAISLASCFSLAIYVTDYQGRAFNLVKEYFY